MTTAQIGSLRQYPRGFNLYSEDIPNLTAGEMVGQIDQLQLPSTRQTSEEYVNGTGFTQDLSLIHI